MSEEIGSLRIDLGTNVIAFKRELVEGQQGIASFAKAVGDQLKSLEDTIKKIGIGLTVGITAPFAAMSVSASRGAGGFEAAMNKVQAAIRGINPKQLAEMSQQARELGPAVGRNATEAAQGIETLALAGMSAKAILGGGLAATMKLAGANAASLNSAAAAVTDVMAQFGKVSSDLPPIVDKITGALDNSKFGFQDFQLAISQAGGVAGAAGVSFEDFNTAIAATSALFASGSDAGTSFKTFITSLNPKSKEAAAVMAQLGLKFFDATGKMKGLAVIAEELQKAIGGLSDKSKSEALTKMFGTDAMRTAIGLMDLGKKGFEDLQKTIAGASAGDKLAIQMDGYVAATDKLSAAFLNLKIAIGETGLLSLFTSVTQAITGFVGSVANAPPMLLKVGLGLWAFAAAIGPLTLALVTLAKLALPLFVMRLGIAGTLLGALINPIGFVAVLFVKLAVALTGATSALSLFALAAARLLVPIGLAITAIGVLYYLLNRQVTASNAVTAATENADKAMAAYEEAALAAASATGEARKEAMKLAAMKRQEALNSLAAARASLADARAKMAQAQAAMAARAKLNPAGDRPAPGVGGAFARSDWEQANANAKALEATVKTLDKSFKAADAVIAAASGPVANLTNVAFGGEDEANPRKRQGSGGGGPSASELADRREELKLQQQIAVATARGDIEEERRLQQKLDLRRREQEYRDAGLGKAAAELAAGRDMADLQAARTEGLQKEIDLAEKEMDLRAAEVRGDTTFIRQRENELFLAERIEFWRRKELTVQQAQIEAETELAQMEAARAERREQEARLAGLERSAELARMRGDSAGRIRGLDRAAELERRTRRFQDEGAEPVAARERALFELDEEAKARMQGDFRDTIKGGFRAAMDGDFKGWFKGFLQERFERSLEDALNNIADTLMRLFQQAFGQGAQALNGGSGGMDWGAIAGSVANLFGGVGGRGEAGAMASAWGPISAGKVPGFKTGGSFEVGGRSGIDANLIQFRATKGEMVNIRRPGNNDNNMNIRVVKGDLFDVIVDHRARGVATPMISAAAPAIVGQTQRTMQRQASRRIP